MVTWKRSWVLAVLAVIVSASGLVARAQQPTFRAGTQAFRLRAQPFRVVLSLVQLARCLGLRPLAELDRVGTQAFRLRAQTVSLRAHARGFPLRKSRYVD